MSVRHKKGEDGTTTGGRVCLGAFAGAHGVKGEAKVKAFTERPEDIAKYGPLSSEDSARLFTLSVVRVLKPTIALVRAPEITGREDAAALAGVRLYAPRTALPAPEEDEFYLEDLVDLRAIDENGAPAGEVAAVHNFGAGDILELKNVPGRKGAVMVPFTNAAVPTVDLTGGLVHIAGIFLIDDKEDSSAKDRGGIS